MWHTGLDDKGWFSCGVQVNHCHIKYGIHMTHGTDMTRGIHMTHESVTTIEGKGTTLNK